MNEFVFNFLGVNGINKTVSKATDVVLALALAIVAFFGVMGVVQWVKRKDFKKVDAELRCMILPLALIVAIYFIFEKLIILNYRPFLIDGVAEPSFPSTHTLITTSVFLMMILALLKYIGRRWVRVLINIVAIVLFLATAFGRVYSGMHWTTDVLGGLIFGIDIALVYGILLNRKKEIKK